jgi:glycosyltransferase involved in cell wall biosynthesis
VPAVSVLLPAYNAGATLRACLASLRRQTVTDWECVLVDDGSNDDTPAIAVRAAAADARLHIVRTPHRGLVAALAAGIEHCRAPLVARMDADDVMHRDRLALQSRALVDDPTLSAVGTHVRIFPRRGITDGLREYETWLNAIDSPARVACDAFIDSPVVHPSLVIRRDVLERFGYRDLGWPEDYDLVLRLLAAGHPIGIVPRRLLAWRDSPDRLTRTAPAYARERLTALKAAMLADGLLAGRATYVLWGYGGTGRALRRALLARGRRPSHVVEVHPGRLGNRIHGAPVVPPETLTDLRRERVVASVAGAEARAKIRAALATMGFVELRDFVCTA